jgi:PAS domain S-box-containing protein
MDPEQQIELLGEAVDGAPVLVFVADAEMRYIAVNDHACEVLQYTREELLSLVVTDVATAPTARADYARMRESGWLPGMAELRRKDGSTLLMHYRAGETAIDGKTAYVSVGWLP